MAFTRQRREILNIISNSCKHLTAEQVYRLAQTEGSRPALGTVYRNLAAFKQEGIIASVGIVDGNERFDRDTYPHAHFICTHCSAVIDVEEIDPPARLSERVRCGSVRDCVLTFLGVCNQCVSADAPK